jgi:hypothetical protein
MFFATSKRTPEFITICLKINDEDKFAKAFDGLLKDGLKKPTEVGYNTISIAYENQEYYQDYAAYVSNLVEHDEQEEIQTLKQWKDREKIREEDEE